MSNWTATYDLRGKRVITEAKPGKAIEKVLDEIQEKAIISVEGSGSGGSGGTPIAVVVFVDRLDNNRVKIRASASIPEGEAASDLKIEIGTVTTVPSSSEASASITGYFPNFVLNLAIPQGPMGNKGDKGDTWLPPSSTDNFLMVYHTSGGWFGDSLKAL